MSQQIMIIYDYTLAISRQMDNNSGIHIILCGGCLCPTHQHGTSLAETQHSLRHPTQTYIYHFCKSNLSCSVLLKHPFNSPSHLSLKIGQAACMVCDECGSVARFVIKLAKWAPVIIAIFQCTSTPPKRGISPGIKLLLLDGNTTCAVFTLLANCHNLSGHIPTVVVTGQESADCTNLLFMFQRKQIRRRLRRKTATENM